MRSVMLFEASSMARRSKSRDSEELVAPQEDALYWRIESVKAEPESLAAQAV